MQSTKVSAGSIFPDIQVFTRDGKETSLIPRIKSDISAAENPHWYLVVVYRGQHCPVCADYLNDIEDKLAQLDDINVKVVAVSADSVGQLNQFYSDKISAVSFPVFAELSVDVIRQMGLYVSSPISDAETDHEFPEPALFLVNHQRQVQIAEVTNAPFVRPDLERLIGGIKYIRENDYPIRGTA